MIYAALITVIVETLFFVIVGYRQKIFIIYCILVNLFTNISLNLIVNLLFRVGVQRLFLSIFIYPLEVGVVLTEYYLFKRLLGGSKKLFLLTFCANILSYSLGVIIFGHI